MKEYYERDFYHSWMILEVEELYEEDYQIRMLTENVIPELLEIKAQGVDDKSIYRYQITGKKSVRECWEEQGWKYDDLEKFVRQLIHVLCILGNYLLDINKISLNINHIYRDGENYTFCYLPGVTKNIWNEFHVLMEDIVKHMDYDDKEGIYLAYELHKASMEEHYDLELTLEKILEKKEQEMEEVKPKKRDVSYDLEDERLLSDWAGVREMTGKVVKDHQTVWGFVNNRINRRKKSCFSQQDFDKSQYL